MENTSNPNEKKANPGFGAVVADHKAEFKKIVWPEQSEVAKKTITVIVLSFLIGLIIFGFDTIYTGVQDLAISLLGLI